MAFGDVILEMFQKIRLVASQSRDVIDHQSFGHCRVDLGNVQTFGEMAHDADRYGHEEDREDHVDPQVPRSVYFCEKE